jgi:hypothetical protein
LPRGLLLWRSRVDDCIGDLWRRQLQWAWRGDLFSLPDRQVWQHDGADDLCLQRRVRERTRGVLRRGSDCCHRNSVPCRPILKCSGRSRVHAVSRGTLWQQRRCNQQQLHGCLCHWHL